MRSEGRPECDSAAVEVKGIFNSLLTGRDLFGHLRYVHRQEHAPLKCIVMSFNRGVYSVIGLLKAVYFREICLANIWLPRKDTSFPGKTTGGPERLLVLQS